MRFGRSLKTFSDTLGRGLHKRERGGGRSTAPMMRFGRSFKTFGDTFQEGYTEGRERGPEHGTFSTGWCRGVPTALTMPLPNED